MSSSGAAERQTGSTSPNQGTSTPGGGGGGGGRGDLVPTMPGFVSKSEGHGSFFGFKGMK